MTLPRQQVVPGLIEETERFGALVRSVDERSWALPTRCSGWTVGDVASHVTGTLADVVAGRLEGIGSQEVIDRQVEERRGRSPSEVADELEQAGKVAQGLLAAFDDEAWDGPAPPGVPGTLGSGVEALWYDAFVHADDIRAAMSAPSERGPGLKAAVSHVADLLEDKGWGPATLALDGTGRFDIGGGGREISGDPLEFVMAATGRADPQKLGLDPSVNLYA